MLVRLRGSATKINDWLFKLDLSLPVVYFDSNDYVITLRMITLDFHFTDSHPVRQFWSLRTTAVDKSALNPDQEIGSFITNYDEGSDYMLSYYEPNMLRGYKIQIPSFHSVEFYLSALKPDNFLQVNYVELLIDISENARIQ